VKRRARIRSLARRFLFGACGLSLAGAVYVFAFLPATSAGSVGLHIDDQGLAENALVGHAVFFGVPMSADGQGTIDIVDAQATGVQGGLTIVSIGGQRPDTFLGRPRYVGMEDEGSLRTAFPLFRLHPLADVHVSPGPNPGWSLAIVAKATRPGDFSTTGLDVTARRGGRTQTFHTMFTIEIKALDQRRRADMSRPLHLLSDCPGGEAPTPSTWADVVRRAVEAGGGEAAVTLAPGVPRYVWNTPDGTRPTQAMVDGGLAPAIYEAQSLTITQVLAGQLSPGPATGFVLGGNIGADTEGACSFPIEHNDRGGQYLAVFGPRLAFDHSAQTPGIELRDLAAISDGIAATPYGPQPISAH
jgi:hypothetical protein